MFKGYFQNLLGALGFAWPKLLASAPFDVDPSTGQFSATGALLDLPALLGLALVTFIAYRGIRTSLRANNLLLILKLTVLSVVVVVGLSHAKLANWIPFAPYGYGGLSVATIFGAFSGRTAGAATGVLAGATIVFFAFGGFEMLTVYSQECRRPRSDVPIGVVATVGLLTMIYIAVAAAITGMVHYDQISVRAPISDAFRAAGMGWAQLLIAFGAVAGMTSVLLVIVMSLPRVLMAIGRDSLIPEGFFNSIHRTFRTPAKAVAFVGVSAMLLGSLLPLRLVMDTVMMATLAGYVAVCVFVLILRRKPSPREPVFRAPLGSAIPLVGITVCLILMLSLPPVNWLRLGAWWVIGLALYAAYGRKHSKHSGPTGE